MIKKITFTADQLKDYTASVTETVLKKMKAAQDSAQDDITKEVWNDLSGKFCSGTRVITLLEPAIPFFS